MPKMWVIEGQKLNILQCNFQVIQTKTAIENMSDAHHDKEKESMLQQRRLTIMIIAIVSVFIICNAADLVWWIWKISVRSHPPPILGCFSAFLQMFNCCINVVIYAVFGKNFRKQFYQTFCSSFQRYSLNINNDIPMKIKTDSSRT